MSLDDKDEWEDRLPLDELLNEACVSGIGLGQPSVLDLPGDSPDKRIELWVGNEKATYNEILQRFHLVKVWLEDVHECDVIHVRDDRGQRARLISLNDDRYWELIDES